MAVANAAADRPREDAGSASAWEMLEVASGIIFVILLLVGIFLPEAPPAVDDPIDVIALYFQDNRGAVLTTGYINVLAGFFFIWFLSVLRTVMMKAEGGTGRLANLAYAGAILIGPMVFLSVTAYSAIAFWLGDNPRVEDQGAVRALFDLSIIAGYAAFIPLAVFLAATGLSIVKTRVLPTWLGWSAIVLAILAIVGAAGMLDADSPLADLSFIVLILFLVWTLALSVILLMRLRAGHLGSLA